MSILKINRIAILILVFTWCCAKALADGPNGNNANELTVEKDFPAVYLCFPLQTVANDTENSIGVAFVIHPSGLLVACNHCIDSTTGILKNQNGLSLPFDLVARVPQYDLAFLKVPALDETEILKIIITPNTQVLKTANPVIGIGKTGNQLTSLQGKFRKLGYGVTETGPFDKLFFFELDATAGCSGGPVFNEDGYVIGLIMGGENESPGITAVNPCDNIEKACHDVMNLQSFKGLTIGLSVETREGNLSVVEVDPDSDAYAKGIRPDDRITAIGPWNVLNTVDYYLSEWAWGMEYPQKLLPLKFISQDGKEQLVNLSLTKKIKKSDDISRADIKQGCPFSIDFSKRVNDDASELTAEGWTNVFDISSVRRSRIEFNGYIEIPEEGSYGFHLIVPGTGTLTIGSDITLKNLIPHPNIIVVKRNYFAQGLHRFTLVVEAEEAPNIPYLFMDSTNNQKMAAPIPSKFIWGVIVQEVSPNLKSPDSAPDSGDNATKAEPINPESIDIHPEK